MRVVRLRQHSPEWYEHRRRHKNASEAPVMMNASPHITRAELVRIKVGVSEKEFGAFQLKLFDKGHTSEAAHRPNAEKVMGKKLYPVVGVPDDNPLLLSSSYDGLEMDEEESWEHKLWNDELAAQIKAGDIRDGRWFWQFEQQFITCETLKRILVSCGDETGERFVWMWYYPVAGRREKIIAGWKQLDEDVANYQHRELPAPIEAKVIRALPALIVDIEGQVKSSNLAVYRVGAMEFIQSIKTELKTDQDFADAEANVKFCDETEKRLQLAKEQALGRTQSIAEVLATLDELRESLRQKRLALEKLVTKRKDEIRAEVRDEAEQALRNHVDKINARFKKHGIRLPAIEADWAKAMKAKRTILTLRDSVDAALAHAKIEANDTAEKISANLAIYDDAVGDNAALFRDLQQLVALEKSTFEQIVGARISTENEKRRAEKERIEREATARAQRDAAAKVTSPETAADSALAGLAAVAKRIELVAPPREAPVAQLETPDAFSIALLVANSYQVSTDQAIAWLQEIDFQDLATAA